MHHLQRSPRPRPAPDKVDSGACWWRCCVLSSDTFIFHHWPPPGSYKDIYPAPPPSSISISSWRCRKSPPPPSLCLYSILSDNEINLLRDILPLLLSSLHHFPCGEDMWHMSENIGWRCELQGDYINPEQLHTVSPSRRRHIASTRDQSLAGGHTFGCNVHTVSHTVNS